MKAGLFSALLSSKGEEERGSNQQQQDARNRPYKQRGKPRFGDGDPIWTSDLQRGNLQKEKTRGVILRTHPFQTRSVPVLPTRPPPLTCPPALLLAPNPHNPPHHHPTALREHPSSSTRTPCVAVVTWQREWRLELGKSDTQR